MAPWTPLHVVTGKGGTGKTTVAAALAAALAAGGRKVLLCEVEGRQGIAQLFDVAPLPYEERRVSVGLEGGEVYALAIDPEAALLEYLQMYYRLGRAGKALDRFGIIDFATTIAPASICQGWPLALTGSHAASEVPSNNTMASEGTKPAVAVTTAGTGCQYSVTSGGGRFPA